MDTMGFLARGLEPNDTYNRKSWAIACQLADQRGCRLLMVAGSLLNAPDPRDQAHPAVFRLVGPGLFNRGLLSQTVINRATAEQLAALDRDLASLPLVSFTIPVGHRPVVRVDNGPGLRDLMRHLIAGHGCRRIVHVRGPASNAESADREAIWRQELTRAGIDVDPLWLVPGDFDFGGLQTIGQDIVEMVGWDFDAVVACNDMAALRVMADLQALGAQIPQDHKVCGFDDIQSGQYSRPSLTTVAQPLADQTRLAWDLADACLGGGTTGKTSVDSVFVPRASCSCGPDRWDSQSFPLLDFHGELPDLVSVYEARRESFQWAVYDLHNFLRDLNGILELDQLPSVLRTWLPRLGIPSFAILTTCDEAGAPLVHEARVEPGTILPTAPGWFEVMTACPNPGYAGTRVAGANFTLAPWIDGVAGRIHGLFPLVVGNSWYGLAVFELSDRAGLLELTVQEQLASVLDRLERERYQRERITESRSRVLAQEDSFRGLQRLVAEVAHELNTPLGAILSSVEFLESDKSVAEVEALSARFGWWNPDLPPALPLPRDQREKRHLLANAFEASGLEVDEELVDNLVDLGCPVDEPVDRLTASLGWRQAVSRMAKITEQRRASWIVGKASRKLADYVAALRQTTKKLGVEDRVACDLGPTIETAWHLVRESVVNAVEMRWQSEPTPQVLGRPGELQQVWINLIRNACQAMGWSGILGIRLASERGGALVEVVDGGPGIPESIRDRVFTPFFTTKPEGEGMGLGLDICRRIVEGHGGTIGFESRPGRTAFTVWLPGAPQTP